MPFKFFTIPTRDDGTAEAELNSFLGSRRILNIDRRWVELGADSYWSFCIDYFSSTGGKAPDSGGRSRGKDYKEVLSPEDFAVFARLREIRKEIGQIEGIPVYTIFTNEQLAQMVQGHAQSKADLAKIAGIGDARIDKYGDRFLELLSARQEEVSDETSGESV